MKYNKDIEVFYTDYLEVCLQGVSTWSAQYSFLTCTKESYANVIVQMCGCLPFYLPYSGTPKRYCSLIDSICLEKNRGDIAVFLFSFNKIIACSKFYKSGQFEN